MANKKLFEGTENTNPQATRRIPLGYPNIEGSEYVEFQTLKEKIQDTLPTALLTKAEANPSWDASTVPTANDIVIDETIGILTFGTINGAPISANNPAIYYLDNNGKAERYVLTTPSVFNWFAKTEGIWWCYFDSTGAKIVNAPTPPGFGLAAPLYRFYYSAVDGLVNTRSAEFHPNTQSAIEHEWKHNAFGTVYDNGFDSVNNALASGAPNASGLNTCISIQSGSNIDDNYKYTITNNTSGNKWSQDLGILTAADITISNGALMKISYNDSIGRLRVLPATRFPFHFVGNVPQFISSTGVVTAITNTNFFVYYIYSLQDDKAGEAVRLRSGVAQYGNIDAARAVQWEDLTTVSPTLKDRELRPLYKLIFEFRTGYSTAIKGTALREILDIRRERVKTISATSTSVLTTNVALATVPSGSTSSNQDQLNIELWGKAGQTIQQNSVSLANRANLNFVSANSETVASDDSANNQTDITPKLRGLNDYSAAGEVAGSMIKRNASNNGYDVVLTTPFNDVLRANEANLSANGVLSTILSANNSLLGIRVKANATATGTIGIGSASNGTDIGQITLSANLEALIPLAKRYFSKVNDTSLYLSGLTAGSIELEYLFIKGNFSEKDTYNSISATSSATITPNGYDRENELFVTAQAAALTLNAPAGTPANGNTLLIRLKDNGTARALTFNAIYKGHKQSLPTTTIAGKEMYLGFIYNSATSKWDMVSLVNEI